MTHNRFATSRRPQVAVVAMSLAITLGACGSNGDDEAEPASGDVVIGGIDYAFTNVPERLEARSTLMLDNESSVEVHELVAIRLPDDETRSVRELVELPPDELAAFFPFVETVLVAPPASPSTAVEGDGTLSVAGRYALICVIPTGADPDEYLAAAAAAEGGPPQVDGGAPHIASGMYAELTVVESSSGG